MKKLIVTAADENFAHLLKDLIDSLQQFDHPLADAVAVLDVGLSESTLNELKGRVTYIVRPQWDILLAEEVM